MKKVILLHGNGGGTGGDNWFPYIQENLQELGVECLAPNMPDPEIGKARIWLPYLNNELGADEDTIIVGHSTGAIAALKFAESNKIAGSVLVGAYHTDLGDDNEKQSGYFDEGWKWDAISNNQNWIEIFASTDDPWIPIEEARYLRDHLKCDYHEYEDRGHFGYDKQMTDFPELLNVLKQRLSKDK